MLWLWFGTRFGNKYFEQIPEKKKSNFNGKHQESFICIFPKKLEKFHYIRVGWTGKIHYCFSFTGDLVVCPPLKCLLFLLYK